MLAPDEEAAVAEQFGVARTQVRRDHLISHLLAALSTHLADQVVCFGGTALSRSFVPDGRLSEDIDLIAVGRRATLPNWSNGGLSAPIAGSIQGSGGNHGSRRSAGGTVRPLWTHRQATERPTVLETG
jgi:hypothetical protein